MQFNIAKMISYFVSLYFFGSPQLTFVYMRQKNRIQMIEEQTRKTPNKDSQVQAVQGLLNT